MSSNSKRPILSGERLRNSLPGRWSMTFFNRPISDRICRLSPIILPGLSSWPYYPRFGRLIPLESRNDQRRKSRHRPPRFQMKQINPLRDAVMSSKWDYLLHLRRGMRFPHGAVALVEFASFAQRDATRAAPSIPNMLVRKRTHGASPKVVM